MEPEWSRSNSLKIACRGRSVTAWLRYYSTHNPQGTFRVVANLLACSVLSVKYHQNHFDTLLLEETGSHQPLPDLVPQDLELQQTEPGAAVLLSSS